MPSAQIYPGLTNMTGKVHAMVRPMDEDSFDLYVTVYKGLCDEPCCLLLPEYGQSPDNTFSWDADEDMIYYVVLHSYNFEQVGSFLLRIEATPYDDICEEANLGVLPTDELVVAASTEQGHVFGNVGH